jgi:hypothetical protein
VRRGGTAEFGVTESRSQSQTPYSRIQPSQVAIEIAPKEPLGIAPDSSTSRPD